MSLLFFCDHKFCEVDSRIYSPGSFPNEVWDRYTSVFGETTVYARIKRQETLNARYSLISNPQVKVLNALEISPLPILKAMRGADFIIARLPSFIGLASLIAARMFRKPYLIELVGCPLDSLWNHSPKGKIAAPLVAVLTKLLVWKAPFVLYVTDSYLQRRYPTKGRSVNCSNVLIDKFDDALVERRSGRSLADRPVMKLCTTGAVDVRYKGQDDVIEALATLRARGGRAYEYHLIGGGNQRYLQERARKLGVEDLLVFHGVLNREQMNEVLEDIDLYLQPSRTEGLPRALIEAMSRGLPAIGSERGGGIPELLDRSMLFGGGSRIAALRDLMAGLNDEVLRAQSKRNYEVSKQYDTHVIEARRQRFFGEFISSSESMAKSRKWGIPYGAERTKVGERARQRAKILIVSGQDVDKRIPIIKMCRGYEFIVMGSSREIATLFDAAGIRYEYYHMDRKIAPISYILSIARIVGIMRREKPDLVQTYDTIPTFLARIAWFFHPVAPVVSTVNGLGELYIYEKHKYRLYRKLYEAINRLLLLGTGLLVFQNHDDLAFFKQKGMVGRKHEVVPGSGIDIGYFSRSWYSGRDRDEARRKLIGSDKRYVVTTIARVVKSKGVLAIAHMADGLRDRRDDVEVILVGSDDTNSTDRLNGHEKQYFSQKVKWLGERKDIRDILYVTDVFIFLSSREGMPRVLMEAAAMEVPSIVLNVPGCREIVKDGCTGFIVHDGHQAMERVLELLGNGSLLRLFGMAARKRMEEWYSLDAIASSMAGIWGDILKRKGR